MSEQEQQAFRRLTIFPGTFTCNAAAALIDSDMQTQLRSIHFIASLLDKSLIVALGRPPARFVMLESVREFGLRRLGSEESAVRERHATHFVRYARDCDLIRQQNDTQIWIDLLQAEHHNSTRLSPGRWKPAVTPSSEPNSHSH